MDKSQSESWWKRHWLGVLAVVVPVFETAILGFLQLVVWKRQGYDLMLTAIGIVVTTLLWLILVAGILKYWRSSHHNAELAGQVAKLKSEIHSLTESHATDRRRLLSPENELVLHAQSIREAAILDMREAQTRASRCEAELAQLKTYIVAPKGKLQVILQPTSGANDKQYLIVTNMGESEPFHAQCTLIDGSGAVRDAFELGWDSGHSVKTLDRAQSYRLRIARMWNEPDNFDPKRFVYIALSQFSVGNFIDTHDLRWSGDEAAIFRYHMDITIFGESTKRDYTERFRLQSGRKGSGAAMEMIKDEAGEL